MPARRGGPCPCCRAWARVFVARAIAWRCEAGVCTVGVSPAFFVLVVTGALFASGAGAFCFFGFGIKAFQCSRIDERMFGQLQPVLKSEDDADEGVVVRGTEPVVRGARVRAR